jgi:ketosteroid isomerase-like protein
MSGNADDIAALTLLNRDYIASVQNGDVRRFEEILAEDYLCSNPDGSLVDRAGFLRQTAQLVTISGLVSEDVRIRLLGDFAIIHGRTRYSSDDGTAHQGRYTDAYARRDGTWFCIAAHVTR